VVDPLAGWGLADQAGRPSVGAVSSRLMFTAVVAELPALSIAVPVTVVPPSLCTVDDAGQDVSPLSWSAQVNVTVTSEWFQPAAFGVGDTCATIVGGVRSSLTCAVIVAVLPLEPFRKRRRGWADQTR
jgi:hypothetical protein